MCVAKKTEKDGAMTNAQRSQANECSVIHPASPDVFQSSHLSHPDPDTTYEVQLKGAGRTPFSRSADGLAVLRSSIPIHALGIPTTRSLALVYLPEMSVIRERLEKACVTTRVAETFIRIGNFEALSPPSGAMFFFGGGQQHADYEALRILAELSSAFLSLIMSISMPVTLGESSWSLKRPEETPGWLQHDSCTKFEPVALGPYASMDVFDPHYICNHSDQEGQYAYNLLCFPCPTAGSTEVVSTMNQIIESTCAGEYGMAFRRHLALRRVDPPDQHTIFQPFLDTMENRRLRFPWHIQKAGVLPTTHAPGR
ncbi:hypothetical protein EDD15DRAFT_2203006 [Pisolithus albus]|nr:hypothetical protein EDD15DRAFT_2203006 [Pisolithus albus]